MKLINPLRSVVATSIAVLGVAFAISAQLPVTSEQRAEANSFFQAQDWTKSVAAYEKIVESEPANPNAKYRLGISLLNLNKNTEALTNLEKAFAAKQDPMFAFALARSYARANNKAKALEVLERAVKSGGITPDNLTSEKDFAGWKSDPTFEEIVKESDIAMYPCKALPESRQFDFWIGDWDVKSPQGQPAGSSSVQLILGQCVIFENWTGIGSAGKSFNFYDTSDKKWHQTWVDDKGTFTHYVGALQDGKMTIIGNAVIAGKTALSKITFSKLPNGDVRQFGENSMDEGKTWTPAPGFDLIYTRKK